MNEPARIRALGIALDPLTSAETVVRIQAAINAHEFIHAIGVNADKVLQVRTDPQMAQILEKCELVNADGASMVLASKLLGTPVPERVAGIDLMDDLCSLAAARDYSVYLVGAKTETVEAARVELLQAHPGIKITGTHHGYFGSDQFDAMANTIAELHPDITFVGITSPKKELFIEHCRTLGLKGVFVGVGGSFDVVSQAIPRAPRWMQRLHMEWFFRLCQEPNRLAKRYLIGNAKFLGLLAREIIRPKKD